MSDHECTEEARITRNEKDIQDMWKVLDELKKAMTYRLPLWATFVIAGLSSVSTGLIVRMIS